MATELKKRTVYEQMQNGIEQARLEIPKNPQGIQQIADKYSLILIKADKVGPGESVPEVGTNAEVQANVTSTKVNEASPVFQLSPTRLGMTYVTAIEASRPSEFTEVEKSVHEQLMSMKRNEAIKENTQKASEKLKASGGSLEAAAKAIGVEIKTTEFVDSKGRCGGAAPVSSFAGDPHQSRPAQLSVH